MRGLISLSLGMMLSICAYSQQTIKGVVNSKTNSQSESLIGASVYWVGEEQGTFTDENGEFEMEYRPSQNKYLIVSYVGFRNDTTLVDATNASEILYFDMQTINVLDEVQVVHRKKGIEISKLDVSKVEKIDEKEFLKAACCDLSESFSTIPSVDVSFTDAVTGTRQIQMLGLAGPYTQIDHEGLPFARGLASVYGLTFVPGAWVDGLHLIKGAGSVVNGFESIAGQINIENRKPETADRLYLNLYANEGGRAEFNANMAHRFRGKDHWSTALLLHGKYNDSEDDRNNDGFRDNLLTEHVFAMNRWKYQGDKFEAQFGVKGLYMDSEGGQLSTIESPDAPISLERWGLTQKINRVEAWGKIGRVFPEIPWRSYGLQLAGSYQSEESTYGLRVYDADQSSLYANAIYQSIIGNTKHKFKTGLSFRYDDFDENIGNIEYGRQEIVPGGFFEYSFLPHDDMALVLGLRADHHNTYGFFVTPRLHYRYAPTNTTVLRVSAGRGQRTANVIAENVGLLASSRMFIIEGEGETPYGLDAEVAWNYGLNIVQDVRIGYRDAVIGLDLYRTDFSNQIVVDLDASPQEARFYNLDGDSYSTSLQLQLDYEIAKRLDLRLAYRWYDVKTTYGGNLLEKPFVASNRAFVNLAYETNNSWMFDFTFNWQGQKRLPSTHTNPEEYQLEDRSPDFYVVNVQVSKNWNKKFEIYTGVENLFDYRQDNPILASDTPFSPFFDASLAWGPIFGRNIYAGLRYRLE